MLVSKVGEGHVERETAMKKEGNQSWENIGIILGVYLKI